MASVTWNYSNGLSPSGAGSRDIAALLNRYKQTLQMNRSKAAMETMLSSLPKVNQNRSISGEKKKNTESLNSVIYQLVPRNLSRRLAEYFVKHSVSAAASSTKSSTLLQRLLPETSTNSDKQTSQTILETQLDVLA